MISLGYAQPPSDVIDFVRSLPPAAHEIVSLPAYQVLDRELIEEARRRGTD